MARSFVLTDIHGCIDELGALIEKLQPKADDRFLIIGDLCDKGPNSIAVIRYVRNLLERYPNKGSEPSVCVAGNHEEKALRLYWRSLKDEQAFGQASPHFQKLEPWAKDMTVQDWKFLESMPLVYKFKRKRPHIEDQSQCVSDVMCPDWHYEEDIILVHGGIYPKFFIDYPEGIGEPVQGAPIRSDWHRGGGKKLDRERRFLRVRYVTPAGEHVSLGEEKPEDMPWADVYGGREGFAFYGHEPRDEVKVSKYAMGLDTGAVHGGKLTAAVLHDGKPAREAEIVQVQSKKYCDRMGE